MRLVLDTNILISSLIKESVTRKIIFNPNFDFYVPDFIMEELSKYLPEISHKAGISLNEVKKLVNSFLENVHVVSINDYKDNLKAASQIIGKFDKKDIPFIAVALSINTDGIWSNDKHFQKQDSIKIFTTKELFSFL
ncbi:MAG: PIN domain-containing protein [Candidatus Helarchaeota archaeon]